MIQIIDEGDGSTAKDVVQELVDWSHQSDEKYLEEIPDDIMNDWLDRLRDTEISSIVTFYLDTISNMFLRGNELDLQGVPVLQRYALLVSLHVRNVEALPSENARLSQVLKRLSKDILALTKPRDNDEVDGNYDYTVRTIVLPTLIRMVEAILTVTNHLDRSILSRISALLLSFDHSLLTTLVLLPSLRHQNLMEDCAIPMGTPCIMTWETVELDATSWKDDLTVRASLSCWKALAGHLDIHLMTEDQEVSKLVCDELHWENVAKAVRAQFFGKEDDTHEDTLVRPSRPLTYPLKVSAPLPTKPAHRREHARIHAAMLFVKRIVSPSKQVLSEILPICYSLIDSSLASLVAIGSTALMVLLDACKETEDWKDFEDTIVSILEIASKTSSDPVALGHVCLACSRTFERLPHRGKDRRRFILRFFQSVTYKMRNRSDENGVLRGVIIGGLIPLLNQQTANAEAMEVGRLGLRVLLPLLRWDFGLSGRKVQVAAVVALTNLMVAAYPIMPHHGGKIVCELMACWGHTKRNLQDARLEADEKELCVVVLALATHASALALVFCGDPARRALEEVRTSKFEPVMVEHAAEVEKTYHQWLNHFAKAVSQ